MTRKVAKEAQTMLAVRREAVASDMLVRSCSWLCDGKSVGTLRLNRWYRVEKTTSGMFHEAGNDGAQVTPI